MQKQIICYDNNIKCTLCYWFHTHSMNSQQMQTSPLNLFDQLAYLSGRGVDMQAMTTHTHRDGNKVLIHVGYLHKDDKIVEIEVHHSFLWMLRPVPAIKLQTISPGSENAVVIVHKQNR